jgi:hypothetical protein
VVSVKAIRETQMGVTRMMICILYAIE